MGISENGILVHVQGLLRISTLDGGIFRGIGTYRTQQIGPKTVMPVFGPETLTMSTHLLVLAIPTLYCFIVVHFQ